MTRDTSSPDQKIRGVTGTAICVRGDDIDTDRIIPARFLRCVTFDGLGEHAFADDRAAAAGSHPFDQEKFRGASILIVGSNFGCGSSREHAPQSLMRWGIRALVGESFAEIFFGNCVAMGIPCLTLERKDLAALATAVESDPGMTVTLDVDTRAVSAGEAVYVGRLPDGARGSFLSGNWDVAGLLAEEPEAVAAVAAKLPYMRGFAP